MTKPDDRPENVKSKSRVAILAAVIGAVATLVAAAIQVSDKYLLTTSGAPSVVGAAPSPSAPPVEIPQAQKVAIPSSCAPAKRYTESLDLGVVGMKCLGLNAPPQNTQFSGPDYVSELSVDEFLEQAIRNSKLIDSYLVTVNGSTEGEAAANYHHMRSVVEFAEFLHLNLENLHTYVSNAPDIRKAIEHGEKIEQYRAQLSRY